LTFVYRHRTHELVYRRTLSESHQNITKSTCYGGNDYDTGDNWKLADWNGATNGGHYTVIFIEMSATW